MKLTLLIIISFNVFLNAHSQGITLLYKGGGSGGWNDSLNWIQINTPRVKLPFKERQQNWMMLFSAVHYRD